MSTKLVRKFSSSRIPQKSWILPTMAPRSSKARAGMILRLAEVKTKNSWLRLMYANWMPCRSYNRVLFTIIFSMTVWLRKTYKEGYLAAFLILAERVLDADLGEEHLLRRIIRGVLDHFKIFPDCNQKIKTQIIALTRQSEIDFYFHFLPVRRKQKAAVLWW